MATAKTLELTVPGLPKDLLDGLNQLALDIEIQQLRYSVQGVIVQCADELSEWGCIEDEPLPYDTEKARSLLARAEQALKVLEGLQGGQQLKAVA